MSTHLPIRIYRPLRRQCVFFRPDARSFSTTSARPARGSTGSKRRRVDPVQTEAAAQHQGGKASSTVYEEQLSNERNLPDDIGLLPGTFIHARHWGPQTFARSLATSIRSSFGRPPSPPPGYTALQKIRYNWKWRASKLTAGLMDEIRYERKWVASKVKGWIMLWRFKRAIRNFNAHFWYPNHAQVKSEAMEKYCNLYRAFAAGDSKAISQMCLSGVAKQFHDRLAARPRGVKMQWKVQDLKCSSWFPSNRATELSLPGYEDTGIQQIVFRIRSHQTLEIHQDSKQTADGERYSPKSGYVEEYFVLQRQVVRGVVKDWLVWGFAKPSDLKSVEEDEAYERSVAAYQSAQTS